MKTDRKLISMKDYVLELPNRDLDIPSDDAMNQCHAYAEFLGLALSLGQFVPCDLEGNVLSEPELYESYIAEEDDGSSYVDADFKEIEHYQQAKDRVVFEGFEIGIYGDTPNSIEFEDLILHFSEMKNYKVEDITGHCDLTPQAVETYKI